MRKLGYPKNILIAPGSFKESIDAWKAAEAIGIGIKSLLPEVNVYKRPIADGGTGVARLLTEVTGGVLKRVKVTGPVGEVVEAHYGVLGDGKRAIVESAQACGLKLVPIDKRNPCNTTTHGVGEIILNVIKENPEVEEIIIGCGDSGTIDCGIGCLGALGVRFYDEKGFEISKPLKGKDLIRIKKIDPSGIPLEVRRRRFTVACNLSSVLCGEDNAVRIYGPQKGASEKDVIFLEEGVNNYANVIREQFMKDISFVPGAGGAGGLASAFFAFFDAGLFYSFDVIADFIDLEEYLYGVELVITGEGRIDSRTATGKAPCAIALRAKKFNIPVIALVGSIGDDYEAVYYNGIDAVFCIHDEPIERSKALDEEVTFNKLIKASRNIFISFYQIRRTISA